MAAVAQDKILRHADLLLADFMKRKKSGEIVVMVVA
jgi:hypothetical protein